MASYLPFAKILDPERAKQFLLWLYDRRRHRTNGASWPKLAKAYAQAGIV